MTQQLTHREEFLLTSPDEVALIKKTNYLKPVDVNVLPEDNNKFIQVIRPLLVELVGTAAFLLVGLWGACSNSGVLTAGLSFGFALVVLAGSFGHISGGHFNPAVTLGILIAGEVQPVIAILYVVMQLLGGIAAGGILRLVLPSRPYAACKGGATVLTTYLEVNTTSSGLVVYETADYVRIWQGVLIELIATFIFVTVVIMVALDTKSKTGLAPILIGFALGINIAAIGAYTSGSLNPARSLGPAIFSNQWTHHYVYWVGPLAGAVIAGLLYRTVWAHPDRRLFVKRPTTTATVTHVKQ